MTEDAELDDDIDPSRFTTEEIEAELAQRGLSPTGEPLDQPNR